MAQSLSPQQRNANFVQMTRQNYQTTPMKTGSSAQLGDTVSFDVPKVRLTSRVRLLVTAKVKATHASKTTFVPNPLAPFNLIRRVTMDLNNGFSPFIVSGSELYMYSLVRDNAFVLKSSDNPRAKVHMGTKASAVGTVNSISFLADLPLTLNDRDPVGLIVTQNQETTLTCTIDFANEAKVLTDETGFTFEISELKVTPMVESFSVPAVPDAFPDISILKLVQASRETIPGAGMHHVSLPTGYTYRKLIFMVTDENGIGVPDSDLAGNIEIVLNQADTPYRVNPATLAKINHEQFGDTLPQGVYAFDWSYQGVANMGGARDYFDTERLTEFWLKLNPTKKGTITCVYEMMSRLRG